MATSKKYYEIRRCIDCNLPATVRKDSKAVRCLSCAKKGKNNPRYGDVKFPGTKTEYGTLHMRINRTRGKASKCILGCATNRYHWANQTGKYEDLNDYIEMCPSCHSRYDRSRLPLINEWGE